MRFVCCGSCYGPKSPRLHFLRQSQINQVLQMLIKFFQVNFFFSNPVRSLDFLDQNLTDLLNKSDSNTIYWTNIFFIKRDPIIRNIQLAIAIYGLCETIFYFYLCYNVTWHLKIINFKIFL